MSAKTVPQTERQFQDAVVEYARLKGWRVAHFRAARTKDGWRTPVAADGAGFPDLCMVRDDALMFCELKSDRGKVSDAQLPWLRALRQTEAEVYIWSPANWPEIEEVLR